MWGLEGMEGAALVGPGMYLEWLGGKHTKIIGPGDCGGRRAK